MKNSNNVRSIVELHPELAAPEKTSRIKRKISLPVKTIKIIATAINVLSRSTRSFKSLRPQVRVLTGFEKYSGESLTLIYVGKSEDFDFVSGCLFSNVRICQTAAPWWVLFQLDNWLAREKCNADILVVDLEFPLSCLVRQRSALQMPRWLKQRVKLPGSWEEILEGMSRKRRREVSRYIRKYDYTWETEESGEAFRQFYTDIYTPYIKARFGDEAILVSEKKFISECRMGTLLRVRRQGETCACNLIKIDDKNISSGWVGYVCDENAVPHDGVSDVLDFYTLVFAHSNGCQLLDLGSSRALINDGVFQYKRKWGAYIDHGLIPRGNIQIRPLRFTGAVKSALSNNAIVERDGSRLFARILLTQERVSLEELKRELEAKQTKGLGGLKFFALHGFEIEAEQWARGNSQVLGVFDLSNSEHPEKDYCTL